MGKVLRKAMKAFIDRKPFGGCRLTRNLLTGKGAVPVRWPPINVNDVRSIRDKSAAGSKTARHKARRKGNVW